MKRNTAAVALTIVCIPLAGHAAGCSYKLSVQPPLSQHWSVEPSAFGPHDVNVPLQPFDRIVVNRAGTTITVESADGSSPSTMIVEGVDTDGGAALILPPCPPRPGLTGSWDRFWAAMNPRESTRFFGAALISRGLETGELARQGGPLRDLTSLLTAQGTVVGTKGLALAWAGGSPPYRISIEDEASGTPLGRTQLAVAELWLPEWQTPPAPFVVIVTDSQGVGFGRHLRPLPPPPIGGDELGDAVAMFESSPEYRLEALRRLFIRSKAGDALAGRAITLIRIAGAGP